MNKETTNNKIKKTNSLTDNPSNCPICGYFAGVSSICVRCGAEINRKISIKLVRRIAVVGSFIGLVLLWIAAYLKAPEPVLIAEINELMNNALVVIEGEVTSVVKNYDRNTLKIKVNDGTGEIQVSAFNKLRKFEQILGDNMPAIKDRVSVTGALNISQSWGATMFLSIPTRVQLLEKYLVKEKQLAEIQSSDEGELFWVQVEIKGYEKYKTRKGYPMHRFALYDGSAYKQMTLFSTEFNNLSEELRKTLVRRGNIFRMLVKIELYKNKPQIKLYDPLVEGHITKIDLNSFVAEKKAPEGKEKKPVSIYQTKLPKNELDISKLKSRKVSEILPTDLGKIYMLEAFVSDVSLGVDAYYLGIENSPIEIYLPYKDERKISNFSNLKQGAVQITAAMKVVEEAGKLQLQIVEFTNIKIK